MPVNESNVNYIKHLTEVLARFTEEEKLSAFHISLYVSLFQIWNMNRFQNPFMIFRSDIMLMSRIGSKSTYHRCLCDLQTLGYLKYFPSKNAFVGSKIEIIPFNNSSPTSGTDLGHQKEPYSPMGSTEMGQPCPTGGHQKEPFNKHIKHNKHLNIAYVQNEFCEQAEIEKKDEKILPPAESKKQKNVRSSNKVQMPPTLEEVKQYFDEKKDTSKSGNTFDQEAQKFFNYFESNGWKVGGRSPMKNWKAAANNWMLNVNKYNLPKNSGIDSNSNHLHVNQEKDYSIPL